MTKDELLKKLAECNENPDQEVAHVDADQLLVEYIGDDEIALAYHAIDKWFA
jgi:hypothetical protein